MKEVKSQVSFNIDKNIYPLEVIYRTAYNFTDNYFIWISNVVILLLINIKSKNFKDLNIKEKFGNDLIDLPLDGQSIKKLIKLRN